MSKEEVIKIRVEADTSDLEKDIENATKKVDKHADQMEKSFNELSRTLDKVKKNMDNAFSTNSSNFNGLTTQLNKLATVATTVGTKIKSTLQKAFNVEGKVKVQQEVQTTNTSSGSGSAMVDSLMTGGTIGAMMNKELAQMNKNIMSTIPKGFKTAIDKSEGMFANMGNSVQKIFTDMANTISKGTIGQVKEYRKLGEDLEFLRQQSALAKKGCNELFSSFKNGMIDANQLHKGLQSTQQSLKSMQEQAKGRGIDLVFNNTDKQLLNIRKNIGEIIGEFNKGNINETQMIKQIMGLQGKIQGSMIVVNGDLKRQIKQMEATLASIDQKSFGYQLGQRFEQIGIKAKTSLDKIQASVNKLKSKLADTTIGKGLTSLNTTIKTKVSPAFQVLQGRCKQLISGFKKVGNSAKKMGNDTKQATNSMGSGLKGLLGKLAQFISIYAIFNGLKNSITSFVNSLQDSTKFATVFGNKTQEMTEWVDKLNSKVTMSKSTIMDFSSNLYRMGKNMGVATDDAMSMAQSMTELGADLVQFTGDANAIEALAGALRGEYDSIQNYGYALDASAVKAKALAMGLDDASESSLLLARQTLLLEQSGDVLGYTARNSQSLAVQLAFLRKNFIELGSAIGSCFGGLLQIVVPVLNRIVQAVTSAFSKIASVINQVFAIFGIKVGGSSGGGISSSPIGSAIEGIGSAIDDGIGGALSGAGGGADKLADGLKEGAKGAKELSDEVGKLLGIDELNILSSPSDSGSGSGGTGGSGSGSGGSGGSGVGSGGIGGGGISDALTVDDSVLSESETKIGELAKKIANALLFIGENFRIGWERTSGYVQSAIERLKGAFSSLGEAIERHLVGFANNGGDRLIQAIGEVTGAVTGLAINIGASIVEMITGLVDHLNPETNPITRFFIDSFALLLENTSKFAQSFSSWWDKLVDGGLGHFVNVCGDVVMLIGGLLCEAIGTAIGWVQQFFDSWVGQAILEGVAGAIDLVATAIEWLCNFLAENREIVYGFAIGLGVVFGGAFVVANAGIIAIIAAITALVLGIGWLWNNWQTVWDGIVNTFNTVKDKIITVLTNIWNAFEDKFPNCAKTVKTVFNNMKTIISSAFNIIKSAITSAIKIIVALFKGDFGAVKDIVKKHFDTCKTNISNIWNAIKSNFTTILNNMKTVATNIFTNIVDAIKSKFNSAKDTALNIFNNIRTGITNAINGANTSVRNVASTIYNNIKDKFNSAKTSAVNAFTNIKTKITSIMDSIRTKVKTIIDAIKGFFSGAKFSLPHIKLPHFSIKPSGWGIGDLLKGTIPSLGISWYSDGRPTTNTAITLINRAKSVELLIS